MTQRSPALVVVLTIITFGIYALVWYVTTKNEMNTKFDAQIPTAWLLIIPFVNIYWIWAYSAGVEKVTKQPAATTFLLLFLISIVGLPVTQSNFNKIPG
ncbi:MAG: DUF4234 domain-containing protein [Myxococcales bacterium]|nr:DUF4234 domain-containing protein [Myxococcales bacterium]MCB9734466.1 DUF4234 domain-containing protein [Deltaproteobacteria bacterium]